MAKLSTHTPTGGTNRGQTAIQEMRSGFPGFWGQAIQKENSKKKVCRQYTSRQHNMTPFDGTARTKKGVLRPFDGTSRNGDRLAGKQTSYMVQSMGIGVKGFGGRIINLVPEHEREFCHQPTHLKAEH
jgi:hypothetical protein